MDYKKNYYAILEISRSASDEVIRSAYKALAKKYHPDTNKADPTAGVRMTEINEAYEILSNPSLRRDYDLHWEAKQKRTDSKERTSSAQDASPRQKTSETQNDSRNNTERQKSESKNDINDSRKRETSQRARRQRNTKKVGNAILIFLAGIIVVFASIFIGSHLHTVSLAEQERFLEARSSVLSESITHFLDPQFLLYLDAGVAYEESDYKVAERTFLELGDYRSSKAFLNESTYQLAALSVNNREYKDAIKKYESLAKTGYKDSEEQYIWARFAQAEYAYAHKQYVDACEYYFQLDFEKYPNAEKGLDRAKQALYDEAINEYRNGDYDTSASYFISLKGYNGGDFKETNEYLDLIDIRSFLVAENEEADIFTKARRNAGIQDGTYRFHTMAEVKERLEELTGFEDALDIYKKYYS